jgi:pilus assembly protein CpaB
MNVKTLIPLIVAVVLGLVAAIVAQRVVVPQQGQSAGPQADLAEVLVAGRDIDPGTKLTAADFKIIKIEKAAVNIAAYGDSGMLAGRVNRIQLVQGQPVVERMLAPVGTAGGLQGVIPDGFRAMTIQIDEFTGVAGFVSPGARVDLLARVPELESQGSVARTIVQNLEILAVGSFLTMPAEAPKDPAAPDQQQARPPARSVTLLVTPADAERIDLAASTGQARLVLRSATDTEVASLKGATLDDLRGRKSSVPMGIDDSQLASKSEDGDIFSKALPTTKPAGKTKTRVVKIIRGGVESEITFEEPIDADMGPMTGGDLTEPID